MENSDSMQIDTTTDKNQVVEDHEMQTQEEEEKQRNAI